MSLSVDQKEMLAQAYRDGHREGEGQTFLTPCPPLVHEAMASYAQEHPADIAAVFGRGDGQEEELSYGMLHRYSNQLAHALRKQGVGPERVVAIAIDRADSLLMLVCFWAVLKAGGAVLLLNPGVSYPRARRDSILLEARVHLILTQRHLLPHLPAGVPRMLLSPEKLNTLFTEESEEMPNVEVRPEALAYLVATSGTTAGEPNLVQIEHRSLANLAQAQIAGFGIHRGDRVLQFCAWTFDAVFSEIVMSSRGATLIMGSRRELRPGPELVHFLARHRVSVATLTPSVLVDLPRTDLAPLRLLICAGEVLHTTVIKRYHREGLQIFNAYGPAECAVCLTTGECLPDGKPPDVGWALPGVELAILNEEMKSVTAGERGTLFASGIMLARGYTNAERTEERFVEIGARRWYNTGDQACFRPSGRVRIFGRIDGDRQLKIAGGRRIQLEEVEQALMRHPSVHAAWVASITDQGQPKRLIAYLLPTPASLPLCEQERHSQAMPLAFVLAEQEAEALKTFLFEQGLEPYMLPVTFLVVPTIPRTLHEKVDLAALEALAVLSDGGAEFVAVPIPSSRAEDT